MALAGGGLGFGCFAGKDRALTLCILAGPRAVSLNKSAVQGPVLALSLLGLTVHPLQHHHALSSGVNG